MADVLNSGANSTVYVLSYQLNAFNGYYISYRVKEFFPKFISKFKTPIRYIDGGFSLGVPPIVFFKEITNAYVEFLVKEVGLLRAEIIASGDVWEGAYIDNTFHKYIGSRNRRTPRDYGEGSYVCTFKGKEITRHITEAEELTNQPDRDLLLNPGVINYLLTNILLYINYGTTEDSHQVNQEFRIL